MGETSFAFVREPPDANKVTFVAGVDETVGEQRHDELDSAVSRWRNGEPRRCNDRDAHRRRLMRPLERLA